MLQTWQTTSQIVAVAVAVAVVSYQLRWNENELPNDLFENVFSWIGNFGFQFVLATSQSAPLTDTNKHRQRKKRKRESVRPSAVKNRENREKKREEKTEKNHINTRLRYNAPAQWHSKWLSPPWRAVTISNIHIRLSR